MPPAELSWAATEVRWQDEAECRNHPGIDLCPDRETAKERDEIAGLLCNHCPVREQCLMYALMNRAEGYWGGTDTAQRRKLSAKKDRAKCPVCSSKNLVRTSIHELCLSCGLSWTRASRPALGLVRELDPAAMERYV